MKCKKALIRVDGGRVWGVSMGHLKRSLTIAGRLSNLLNSIFVMRNYIDGVKYARLHGAKVEVIDSNNDSDEAIIAICKKHDVGLLICDLPQTPYTTLFDYAREQGIVSIVFDIVGGCLGSPDVIINDSFVAEFTRYQTLSLLTQRYTGTRYTIFDSLPEIVPLRERIEDIMITMGGSDPAGLTPKILTALGTLCSGFTINVVLGPSFNNHEEVYKISGVIPNLKIIQDPVNFMELLSRQDMVITAGGRTLCECAYLGRPAIIVPSIGHEEIIADSYERITGAVNLGMWDDEKTPGKLETAIELYSNNFNKRMDVFSASRMLFDGQGLERVTSIISDSVKATKSTVKR